MSGLFGERVWSKEDDLGGSGCRGSC
jgi:hypothetical protein